MCKYIGPFDANYRTVVDTIKGFLEFSPTRQLWKVIGAEDAQRLEKLQELLELRADPIFGL